MLEALGLSVQWLRSRVPGRELSFRVSDSELKL